MVNLINEFFPYIWPKGRADIKSRIILALIILIFKSAQPFGQIKGKNSFISFTIYLKFNFNFLTQSNFCIALRLQD